MQTYIVIAIICRYNINTEWQQREIFNLPDSVVKRFYECVTLIPSWLVVLLKTVKQCYTDILLLLKLNEGKIYQKHFSVLQLMYKTNPLPLQKHSVCDVPWNY